MLRACTSMSRGQKKVSCSAVSWLGQSIPSKTIIHYMYTNILCVCMNVSQLPRQFSRRFSVLVPNEVKCLTTVLKVVMLTSRRCLCCQKLLTSVSLVSERGAVRSVWNSYSHWWELMSELKLSLHQLHHVSRSLDGRSLFVYSFLVELVLLPGSGSEILVRAAVWNFKLGAKCVVWWSKVKLSSCELLVLDRK